MKHVGYAEVLSILESVVASNPERVYEKRPNPNGTYGCYYSWKGQPDCIVGHVLTHLGVDPEEMHWGGYFGEVAGYLEAEDRISFDRDAHELLSSVQGLQDIGSPWGAALAGATLDVAAQKSRR